MVEFGRSLHFKPGCESKGNLVRLTKRVIVGEILKEMLGFLSFSLTTNPWLITGYLKTGVGNVDSNLTSLPFLLVALFYNRATSIIRGTKTVAKMLAAYLPPTT